MTWLAQVTGSPSERESAVVDKRSTLAGSSSAGNAWRRELLVVDFRHAVWAFTAYLFAAVLFLWGAYIALRITPPAMLGWSWMAIGLVAPAVIVVRIFATDFAHRSDERLLVCPVPRRSIWLSRLALSAAMVFLPPVVVFLLLPILGITPKDGERAFILSSSVMGIYVAWCAWSFGPLVALLLRRPILVFSVTVISPFAVALLLALGVGLTGPQWGISPTPDAFPYIPAMLLLVAIVLGVISQIIAARVWNRLEVRS